MERRGLKTFLKSVSVLALFGFLAGVLPGPVLAQQAVVLPVPVALTQVAPVVAANLRVAPVLPGTLPVLATPKLELRALPVLPAASPSVAHQAAAADAADVPAVGPVSAKPLHLLISGAPGSGKTTFGKLLAKDYGVVHISVGELLRAQAGSVPGLAETMAKGGLVDSEIVRRIVTERLAQKDVVERGFILDGFPRRMEEAGVIEGWMKDGGRIDAMIQLEVSDDELLRRILARGRMDDSEEVFRNRMEIYRRQTRPVLEHFRERLRVLEAKTEGSDIGANYARVRALVETALALRAR